MFSRKKDPNKILHVMHTDDMVRVHPFTDWIHNCSKCGGRVGIYPSGQKVLQQFPDMYIVCNRCLPNSLEAKQAPGAVSEPFHSRWRYEGKAGKE